MRIDAARSALRFTRTPSYSRPAWKCWRAENSQQQMAMNDPITATTRICAVYGHPIKHSASPAMQNAGIAALGLNWRYVAFDVHPDNLREAIAGAKAMRFLGLNLTVPHKLVATKFVDVIDPSARPWRAINTVTFQGWGGKDWEPLALLPNDFEGKIRSVGLNTDADAIIRSLKEDLQLSVVGKKVFILGAGGAGRAAALRIAQENPAELWLYNRTESKAAEVAKQISRTSRSLKICLGAPSGHVDLLVNATSLGLKPDDPLPIHDNGFDL